MAETHAVTIVTRHPLAKWVIPLGMLGLVPLAALAVLLPREQVAAVFGIGRFVFVILYMGLVSFAFMTRRRRVTVVASPAGIHEAGNGALVVANADIEDVLHLEKSALQELQVRGRVPLTMEVASAEAAYAILRALGRSPENATHRFLAKTTPIYYAIATWMGMPMLGGLFVQMVLLSPDAAGARMELNAATLLPFAPVAAVFLFVWAFGTYWFSKRRELVLAPTYFTYPRLFVGRDEYPYHEVESVRAIDTMTVSITIRGGATRRFTIYNPDEVAAYLEFMRVRIAGNAYAPENAAIPMAGVAQERKYSLVMSVIAIPGGLFLTVVLGLVAGHQLKIVYGGVRTQGTIVESERSSRRNGDAQYAAVLAYGTPSGEIYRIRSASHENEPLHLGEQRTVFYDPARPSDAVADDFASRWSMPILWLLGPITMGLGVYGLFSWRKKAPVNPQARASHGRAA